MRIVLLFLLVIILASACKEEKNVAWVEQIDPALDAIVSANDKVTVLAEGFEWSEGPVWIDSLNFLLFSDVPKNIVHKWSAEKGLEDYLSPSGYTKTSEPNTGEGANGLLLNSKNELVLCQHGDRRIAVMQAALNSPAASFKSLADVYNGKKFNSPNDAVYNQRGDLFFTDPPYGLANQDTDSAKQLSFNGVYKMSASGEVTLLIDSLTRPNGIAFMNNEKTLLVANSDKSKARWYAYELTENESIISGRIFYDATKEANEEIGLPDGLKINSKGIVFASGPGGIWIFDSTGKLLGKIRIIRPAANCALSKDEKILYITAERYLLKIDLK